MPDERVISHKAFSGVVDSAYVDLEDLPQSPIMTLDECANMTPFRKSGSLKQVCGFFGVRANADLPSVSNFNLTGFVPFDSWIFGIDKDSKEITLLVYKKTSTGETRFFISPYWNPSEEYDNFDNAQTPNSWITGWQELTEHMQEDLLGISSDYAITFQADFVTVYPLSNVDDYLNGFFVVNMNQTRCNRYNYITDWNKTSKIATVKGKVRTATTGTDWAVNDDVRIYRFPVAHTYKMGVDGFGNEGAVFDANPTQYKYKENELRIPCGKENRPLFLGFIQKRKYLLGNENDMAFDGFWFDFQQIPQVMRASNITGFKTRSGGAGGSTSWDIATGNLTGSNNWVAATTGKVQIELVSGTQSLGMSMWDSTRFGFLATKPYARVLIPGKLIAVGGNNCLYFNENIAIDSTDFVNAFNVTTNPFYPTFEATVSSAGNITTGAAASVLYVYSKTFIGSSGGIFNGVEAGGNQTAFNPFIGIAVTASDSSAAAIVDRHLHIINAIIDNRSQILISHGTYATSTNTLGLQVKVNLWFSRRLTGISLFNQTIEATTNGASGLPTYSVPQEKYPFFNYVNEIGSVAKLRINELKHFTQYDIFDFSRAPNGELTYKLQAAVDTTTGINSYTYDQAVAYWYVWFRASYNGVANSGVGMKYVAKCNRYIDQDTTMNYERCEFNGQTNGRFFLIGVKNDVERITFESNDVVCYNNYSGAVSEYDTYLRDRFMLILFGDKDRLRAIENYNGYLFLAKDNNSFALEVNTDNEIKYRVIDTRLGRGVADPNMLLQTPFGLIMPTNDGVWLVSQDGSESILSPTNGKFELYKSLFENNSAKSIVYSKKHNELCLMFQRTNDPNDYVTYIFFYSFNEQKWGGYYYLTFNNASGIVGSKPTVLRENTSGEITFFNYDGLSLSNFRIDKFYDSSFVFIKSDGTSYPIVWNVKTHFTPYSGRYKDTRLNRLTLLFNSFSTSGTKSVIIKIYKDDLAVTSYTLELMTGNANLKNQIKELLCKMDGISSTMAFSIENDASNNFSDFTINGVDLWITDQARKPI